MAQLLMLTLASLLAGAQAAVRTEILRRDVGECAAANSQMTFTQGKVLGGLPSAPVLQAETDVVGADLIAIEYASNYKVLTEKMSKEHYVLTQCGTAPPSQAELAGVLGFNASYTVKHFTIPLQVVSSSSTVHLAFFKALGVEDRVKYISKYASGPCWQKALACGGELNTSAASGQMAEVGAHFMDCKFGGNCDNVNKEAKGVHFSASQDPGPLRSAEHIKFVAAFFNKEALATKLFANTLAAYTSASVTASPKPVVAWISFAAKSSWAPAAFTLSQASYKLKMVVDAGGANVDGAAVKAKLGSNMSMSEAVSGKTYTAKLSSFNNGSKPAATAAFFAALDKVDIIIDETYAFAPKSYTFDSFMTQMGLTNASTLKFMKNKMVLRIDGTISENDGLDWFESRIAHPDWAVEGLAHQIHADASKKYMYFRNIAKGEAPKVLSKSMCTATLPACNASSYPAPINMMLVPEPEPGSKTAVVTSKGTVAVKMSKADATALVAKPTAKAAFASAVAKTTGLAASKITITAIYVDGVKVARRLATESTVTFDWEAKHTGVVTAASMDATTLQTQIVAEIKAVAGLTVAITSVPTVTIVAQPSTTNAAEATSTSDSTSAFSSIWVMLAAMVMGSTTLAL